MFASDAEPRNKPAVVLVLAHPDDPVAIGFSRYISGGELEIWQPKFLEDIEWSYSLDSGVELRNRSSGRCYHSRELAGIWYQSWPPLTAVQELEERDHRYVLAELSGSMRAIWHAAQCAVIGHAWTITNTIDFGLESRIELRRHGLPTLTDQIGSFQFLRDLFVASNPEEIWITRTQGTSTWLSDMLAYTQSELELSEDELMAATVTDNRHTCIALHVDTEILLVDIEGDTIRFLSPQDRIAFHIDSIVYSLRSLTGARVGVTYLARQQQHWKVARFSLQIPYWLNDRVAFWLYPRLANIFASSIPDQPDAGPTR